MKNKNTLFKLLALCLSFILINANATDPLNTIVIDNARNLQIDGTTQLKIDRRTVPTTRVTEQMGTGFLSRTLPGYKAQLNYSTSGNPSDGGLLNDINLLNSVIGPVTANQTDNFEILFVKLVIDADTIIEGIDDIASIQTGAIVAASGIENADGTLKVTRLEYLNNGSPYWLITGDVANLTASSFSIGQQNITVNPAVDFASIVVCNSGTFENGQKVIVEIETTTNYVTGQDLTALVIICYEDFEPPVDPPTQVFFNGDISQIGANQSSIIVNGRTVIINQDTNIITNNGSTVLEVGMNVSITGVEDVDTLEVTAEYILVNDTQNPPPLPIVLYGNISGVSGNSFVLDNQNVDVNPTTEYFGGSVSDLVDGALIELIALQNEADTTRLNALQITFITSIPPPGNNLITVTGTIANINADLTQFDIGNEGIDVTSTTLIVGTQSDLTDGLNVVVDGTRQDNGRIVAEFILVIPENPGNPPGHVCVSGTIQTVNVDQSQFTLDTGAVINVSPQTAYFDGTVSDLITGAVVDISGVVNDTTAEIDADAVFFQVDTPPPPNYVFFHGFISHVTTDKSQITLDDTVINIQADTQIIGGTVDDLVIGLEVQVDGVLNQTTNEVDAQAITIPQEFVSGAAPILPEDITLSVGDLHNGVVTIMGILVHQNDLTSDASNIFRDGIASEQSATFYGYQDDSGKVWASSINVSPNTGTPNNPTGPAEIYLNANVTEVSATVLKVLNVTIGSLDTATFVDENFNPISAAEFLASLSVGDGVLIANATSYDRDTQTLNAGVVFKDNVQRPTPKTQSYNKAGTQNVKGSGIVTNVIEDIIFGSSF